jgi:hypothetical protein
LEFQHFWLTRGLIPPLASYVAASETLDLTPSSGFLLKLLRTLRLAIAFLITAKSGSNVPIVLLAIAAVGGRGATDKMRTGEDKW